MSAQEWMQARGLHPDAACRLLLYGLDRTATKLDLDLRSDWTLSVRLYGPQRADGSYAWSARFNVEIGGDKRVAKEVFVQAFNDPGADVPALTGRLLVNLVNFSAGLQALRVEAVAHRRNSAAYLRAGFLPLPSAWSNLSERLLKQLPAPLPLNLRNAETAIRATLSKPTPSAMRELIPGVEIRQSPGLLYPHACKVLLDDGAVTWTGVLDREDGVSEQHFQRFAAAVG